MKQPFARVNQHYATLMLASPLREMFGVQLYKNNARALLSRILSILTLDWLQHARSVRGVYELDNNCAPSFLRLLCEIGGDCFEPRYFSEGAQLPKKNTDPKQSPTNSHNDRNKDGAKLLLSLMTAI